PQRNDGGQARHVVHGALPGAVQDLLRQLDVLDLITLGAGAVVVAGVVAQIDVVGQGLSQSQDREESDQKRPTWHALSSPGSAYSGTRSDQHCRSETQAR